MFYGWVVVGVVFLTHFVLSGSVFYAFAVFLKPLAEDLGGGRFGVGAAMPLIQIVGAGSGPWIGRLVERHSIRWLMLTGALFLGAGFLCLARVTALWQYYLVYAGPIAIGMALGGGVPSATLLTRWFSRRRGTALGVAQIGLSAAGVAFPLLAGWLISSYGWRFAAGSFGWIPLLVLAPVVALLAVDRPELRGLGADGARGTPEAPLAPPAAAPAFPTGAALRDRRLWLIAAVVGLNFSSTGALVTQIHAHATDLGHAPLEASRVLAAMALAAACGKLLFGLLGDRLGARPAFFTVMALCVAGLLGVIAAGSHGALLAAALCFGLGYGGVMPLWGVLLGAVYGPALFGRAMGLMGPIMLPFQVFGVPFATAVFDRTGSYEPAFVTFMGFHVLAALLLATLKIPRPD